MILVAGPCVIESREIVLKIAELLEQFSSDKRVEFYFKASFDKANRTSLESFRGIGFEEGLAVLDEVKREFGYKILTDIHETSQVGAVSEVVDVLQIPAFLSRQTDLLVECAKTERVVNIKKGQFLSANEMQFSALKVLKTRGVDEVSYTNSKEKGLWLTERGNSFGYNNLVVDMRNLVTMREFAPVVFDATHSVQAPGGLNGKSGGDNRFVEPLARSAASVGVDGFFFETHFDPSIAKSDATNMIDIERLKAVVEDIFRIREALS
jgi:2-dehydro-3-deoxyphosphooctonate aldolase (KDO 8-P synthase)